MQIGAIRGLTIFHRQILDRLQDGSHKFNATLDFELTDVKAYFPKLEDDVFFLILAICFHKLEVLDWCHCDTASKIEAISTQLQSGRIVEQVLKAKNPLAIVLESTHVLNHASWVGIRFDCTSLQTRRLQCSSPQGMIYPEIVQTLMDAWDQEQMRGTNDQKLYRFLRDMVQILIKLVFLRKAVWNCTWPSWSNVHHPHCKTCLEQFSGLL